MEEQSVPAHQVLPEPMAQTAVRVEQAAQAKMELVLIYMPVDL
jgi:hypothetical protein